MSAFEKLCKNACKPKAAIPKAKYVDPIITATYSGDSTIADIARAISNRIKEPNSIVVFKSLILLHQLIRQGATDAVLGYLSSGQDVLKLRNVTGQSWEGYKPPKNLAAYAAYLNSRITNYRVLKHDPVRAQSENARSANQYDGVSSKVKKLRSLSVDKGLFKEIKAVQAMISSAVNCRFFEDDLEDPNTVLAYKFVLKDSLIMTAALNEGIVNMLEHYFEMAKPDAQEALRIYKAYISQTEQTTEFLAMARSLNSTLDVPVPYLKNAPTSLVQALEEYLNSENFETNRAEYRQNMAAANVAPTTSSSTSAAKQTTPTPASSAKKETASAPAPAAQQSVNKAMQDFLSSIEEEQKHPQAQMMLPQITGVGMMGGMGGMGGGGMPMGMGMNAFGMGGMSPQQAQQAQINPFRQSMMFPQATGFQPQMQMPFQPQPQGGMMQPQSTGFVQPFMQPSPQRLQPNQQTPFTPTSQQQYSGVSSPFSNSPSTPAFGSQQQYSGSPAQGLQPQSTGINPFRQSVMGAQSTGMPNFMQSSTSSPASPAPPFSGIGGVGGSGAPRPTSALAGKGSTNPFHLPSDDAPKPVTGPSLFELAQQRQGQMMQGQQTGYNGQGIAAQQTGYQQQQQGGGGAAGNMFGNSPFSQPQAPPPAPATQNTAPSNNYMSELASAFSIPPPTQTFGSASGLDPHVFSNVSGLAVPQMAGEAPSSKSFDFSSLNLNATNQAEIIGGGGGGNNSFGNTNNNNNNNNHSSGQPEQLQPQKTGFGGSNVKKFQPTSSFGSSLMTNLPPVSSSPSPTFSSNNNNAQSNLMAQQSTGYNPFSNMGQQNGGMGGMGGMGSGMGLGNGQQQQQQQQQQNNNAFAAAYGQPSQQQNGMGGVAPNHWATSFGN